MSRFFIAVASLALVTRVFASHLPAPTGYVNDFAGVLHTEEKESLENDLASYKESTGNEIAVALIKSLDGDTVEDVAVRTFEEWKIGEKGKENGVLFLAAIDDRKMRIEVGYGLEPLLTDGEAGEILRRDVTPAFREGKYGEGIAKALDAIEAELAGAVEEVADHPSAKPFPIPFSIIVFLFIYLCAFMARSKSVWLGGVAGGLSGAGVGWWIGSVATSAALAVFFALIGVLLDAILSRNYEVLTSKGGNTGFFSSRGGFWSSSGKSSGSFGGFSGGSSGGGGASSSW